MMGVFALAPGGDNQIQLQTVLEHLATPATIPVTSGNTTFLREDFIQQSDTISSLISRLRISDPEALEFIRRNPETQIISRQLRPGKLVTAITGIQGELMQFYFPPNGNDEIQVVERRGNSFISSQQTLPLKAQTVVKSGEILSSLFSATDSADIPDAIATQLAEVFGSEIDFHRNSVR